MGTYRSGSQSQIVIGNETSFNTMYGTPVGTVFRKSRFVCGGLYDLIEDNELRADPNPAQQETGLKRTVARLTIPVTTEEVGQLMYWFFGDYGVTGVGDPYTHEYNIDTSVLESLWIECGDLELGKYDLFNGCVMSGFSLQSIEKTSNLLMMVVDFECSGKWTKNGAAAQDSSPVTYAVRKHTLPELIFKVDDSATALITNVSYACRRNVTMYAPLDGNDYMSDFDLGDYSFDFTVSGWRDASDTIYGYDDDAEHGFEILSQRAADATHYLSLDHNECFAHDSEQPNEVSDDGPSIATVRVAPTYINHADGSSVVCKVVTEVADYSAITGS